MAVNKKSIESKEDAASQRRRFAPNFTHKVKVNSPNVAENDAEIRAQYDYRTTRVASAADGTLTATPVSQSITLVTQKKVPKLGVMLVGLGGNNGTTLTAGILANRHGIEWQSRRGLMRPNYFGSVMMATTIRVGYDANNQEVYVPLSDMLPIVDPSDIVIGGWDINKMNLADAMTRAQVLDYDLQCRVRSFMEQITPLPSVYYPEFIAANQEDRADNVIPGTKQQQLEQLRNDIRRFKAANSLDKVIVVWTANTERFSDIVAGVNDSADALLKAIGTGHAEISPSTLFAVASILEGCPFINGSPQNTFVPGAIELANRHHVHIGGDDFKSGQTKVKSVMVDFLVNAGIKPVSITSYNHLGNNDGKNLSAPEQFRSKEISKSNVVDDMVSSNRILYAKNEKPDHVVVIKYVPAVGDSKRALDEYESEIFMGGRNTISMHNTCEDSLLASPLIIDLVLLCELLGRISVGMTTNGAAAGNGTEKMQSFNSILSFLSYMLKAPIVPKGAPLINALFRQRSAIENLFRACLGLAPESELMLESRM